MLIKIKKSILSYVEELTDLFKECYGDIKEAWMGYDLKCYNIVGVPVAFIFITISNLLYTIVLIAASLLVTMVWLLLPMCMPFVYILGHAVKLVIFLLTKRVTINDIPEDRPTYELIAELREIGIPIAGLTYPEIVALWKKHF